MSEQQDTQQRRYDRVYLILVVTVFVFTVALSQVVHAA